MSRRKEAFLAMQDRRVRVSFVIEPLCFSRRKIHSNRLGKNGMGFSEKSGVSQERQGKIVAKLQDVERVAQSEAVAKARNEDSQSQRQVLTQWRVDVGGRREHFPEGQLCHL